MTEISKIDCLTDTELDPRRLVPELTILEENDRSIEVSYRGEEYKITPANDTYFIAPSASSDGMSMLSTMSNTLQLGGGIFQATEVPDSDFRIPMIVHEIEESLAQALNGDSDDECDMRPAHRHALMAELLYVQAHFSPDKQRAYFAFAQKYRLEKTRQGYFEALRQFIDDIGDSDDKAVVIENGLLTSVGQEGQEGNPYGFPLMPRLLVDDAQTYVRMSMFADNIDDISMSFMSFIPQRLKTNPRFVAEYCNVIADKADDLFEFLCCYSDNCGNFLAEVVRSGVDLAPTVFKSLWEISRDNDDLELMKALVLNRPHDQWPEDMQRTLSSQASLWFWVESGIKCIVPRIKRIKKGEDTISA